MKKLLLISIAILFSAAACNLKQVTVQPAQNQQTSQKATDETANWKTYKNDKYGFEISYPDNWGFNTNTSNGKDGFFISFSHATEISIIPQGEFDYGPPWTQPAISNDVLTGKKVKIQKWDLDNGAKLVWYKFTEPVSNWNADNRLDVMFASEDSDVVNKIVSTFKFTK